MLWPLKGSAPLPPPPSSPGRLLPPLPYLEKGRGSRYISLVGIWDAVRTKINDDIVRPKTNDPLENGTAGSLEGVVAGWVKGNLIKVGKAEVVRTQGVEVGGRAGVGTGPFASGR